MESKSIPVLVTVGTVGCDVNNVSILFNVSILSQS